MYWIEFFISAGVIVFSGVRLTHCADQISEKMQIGKLWVGILLLGIVTSLPEAITSLISVISLQANDLAVGNILGSNNFNPMLIVIMDIFYRKGSITNAVHPQKSHRVSAIFAIALTLIVFVELAWTLYVPPLGGISVGSILIAILYFIGMGYLGILGGARKGIKAKVDLRIIPGKLWINLFVSAILIVVGAMLLANSAETIAQETGLGRTFVGSVFLALATSLPELAVSLSALRLGAFDLAIGNIFGSNMTNVFIIFLCDLGFPGLPLLGEVSSNHMLTALLNICLMLIVFAGIHWKNKKVIFGIGIDSILMTLCFFAGTGLLYKLR